MASQNFATSTQSFRMLFGNGSRYQIPVFQRDYSWDEDQWDDLWVDITQMVPGKDTASHYMGYLVLSGKNDREYSVIDGQQRLTTLTLLILAGLKFLDDLAAAGVDSADNQRRSTQLRANYIGYLDPVTLVTKSKLTLNRANDPYFQNYVVPLQPLPKAGLRASQKLLRNAFEWFFKKINERFAASRSGQDLAKFIEEAVDRLLFTVIEVDNDFNAFAVFETLNSRGVKLAPIDLLKNYLFSVVDGSSGSRDRETSHLEERWSKIANTISEASFTDFLRVYWNSKYPRVRESGLFKAVRRDIDDNGKVFELVRSLDADAEIYAALSDSESELWSPSEKASIEALKLFRVKQSQSLLLSAHRILNGNGDDFARLLRACVVISFRYNVIVSGATGDQETVYNNLAKDVSNGKVKSVKDIIHGIRPLYKGDDEFRAAFAQKSFPVASSKIVLYILKELECQSSQIAFDTHNSRYDLEHIFPINPDSDWPGIPTPRTDDLQLRLGNLSLLEKNLNKDAGNRSFSEKRKIYASSLVPSVKQIAVEYEEWGKKEINERQLNMAKVATSIWRLSELH